MRASKSDLLQGGVFSVPHILSRTALELPDPELKILGIDPFKRISKKNLLILGLLYKAKIFLTQRRYQKYSFTYRWRNSKGSFRLYFALVVECFWNAAIIKKSSTRSQVAVIWICIGQPDSERSFARKNTGQLSPLAQTGCLRAIGNAVVMARNYHPNMIILLIRFQQLLGLQKEDKYDDWNLFLETLEPGVSEERNFLLDLFTVSAAFDGKLSAS